jgi:hypothetical protein
MPQRQYNENQQTQGVFSAILVTERNTLIIPATDIAELYFVEDMFKQCMVGKIKFIDRVGLQEFAAFSGSEKINIVYSVERKTKNLVFDIWKVGKISEMSAAKREQQSFIEITFVDPFFAPYTIKRYSRSFVDMKVSEIIRYILETMMFMSDSGAEFEIEESLNRMSFVMPYWTPRQALLYLLPRARSARTGEGGYITFNNTNSDKVNLKSNILSLNYLFSDALNTLDPTTYKMEDKDSSSRNTILEWYMTGVDRNSNSKIKGMTFNGYDFTKKKILTNTLEYSDGVERSILLGKNSLYGPIDDPNSYIMTTAEPSEDRLDNIIYTNWVKRYSKQNVLNLIVEGDENRYAGQMIEIEWPSRLQQEVFNQSLRGKYLIMSITHSFGARNKFPYVQRLTLLKNAYHNMESEWLVPASKINRTGSNGRTIIIKR